MYNFAHVLGVFLAFPLHIQAFGGHQLRISSRPSHLDSYFFSLDFYHTEVSQSSWSRWKVHYAIVYDENGEVLLLNEEGSDDGAGRNTKMNAELLEWLTQKLDMSSLSRLACAYAKPPHDNLHPKKVDSAHIVHVDETRMDLAIALADVQVLVSLQ